jgi:hypothetical protein
MHVNEFADNMPYLITPALCLQQPEPEACPVLILQDEVEALHPLCAPICMPLNEQLPRVPACACENTRPFAGLCMGAPQAVLHGTVYAVQHACSAACCLQS